MYYYTQYRAATLSSWGSRGCRRPTELRARAAAAAAARGQREEEREREGRLYTPVASSSSRTWATHEMRATAAAALGYNRNRETGGLLLTACCKLSWASERERGACLMASASGFAFANLRALVFSDDWRWLLFFRGIVFQLIDPLLLLTFYIYRVALVVRVRPNQNQWTIDDSQSSRTGKQNNRP